MTHDTLKTSLPDAETTLIFPDLDAGPLPEWATFWANTDAGVIIAHHHDPHHALPAVREFETAQLIFANPGAVAVGDGMGATVLLRILAAWPNLPLAAVLLIDPVDPAFRPRVSAFGPLPDGPLPVPAILYLTRPATRHDRALARRWDCVLAEGEAKGATPTREGHLPRLRSLRDQLARFRRPDAVASPVVAAATPPVPVAKAPRPLNRVLPLPHILV